MDHSTPAVVTMVSQFSGQQRTIPQQGGHVKSAELESLMVRLRTVLKVTAHLAETVEQIRLRALHEQEAVPVASPPDPVPLSDI